MTTNAITQLERDLLTLLKDEYSFYQSLYILLDKQRDLIRFDKDDHLLDLYAEIERCQRRIKDSEEKLNVLCDQNKQMFRVASAHPEIKKTINCIVTLVKKNITLVSENEAYVLDRHQRIKHELDDLRTSDKIMQYLNDSVTTAQFVDGKQ